jgi:dihydroorotase
MPNYEIRISGGDVYVAGSGLTRADLLISEGIVQGLVEPESTAEAARTIDATGMLILPGIIDTHAHTRDPGYTHKEDFLTASQAGAAGGVTTMFDMPNVEPPTDTAELFEEKRERAASMSVIDWGHWVAGANLDQIPKLAAAGACGYKIFQVSGAYPHDPRLAVNDDGRLVELFRAIEETGLPCLVHPFNQSLFEQLSKEAFAAGKPANHVTFGEVYTTEEIWSSAVSTLLALQRVTGVRLHLVHTHSAQSLALIRAAKQLGQRVSCAVDPKYYHLTVSDLVRQKGRACPGGFITEDQERMAAIWRALGDGTIDAIDADHAPHTLEELAVLETDAWHAAMGSPQYDWQYSLTLTDVAAGKVTLRRAVELLAEGPAKLTGLYPRKGVLLPGSDADLVLVDPDEKVEITDDGLYTKVKWTPYLGWTLTGLVRMTMLRGTEIMRDRKILVEPGFGKYVAGVPQ